MKLRGIVFVLATSLVAFAQAPNGAAEPGNGPGNAPGADAMEMQAPPPGPGPEMMGGPGGMPGGEQGRMQQGHMQGRGPGGPGMMLMQGRMQGGPGPMTMGMMRGPMGPPRIEALKSYLKLTDEQVKSVHALLEDRGKKAHEAMEQVVAKRRALMESLHKPGDDANAPKQALDDFQATRKQLDAVDKEFQTKLAGVLKPEQLSQLKDLEKAAEMQRAIHEAGALGLIKGQGPGPGMMMGGPWHGQGAPPNAPPAPVE